MADILFIGANNPETAAMLQAIAPSGEDQFVGFIDNDPAKAGRTFCGLPVIGGFDCLGEFDQQRVRFVNLITRDTKTRFETSAAVAKRGFKFANFVHPSVDCTGVTMGTGNYIQRGVTLQRDIQLGDNNCINSGSTIAHETTIGSSVFIAPGVTTAGVVDICDGVMLGVGATVLPRISIAPWTIVGGGAVVVRNTEHGDVVAGNPARVIRRQSNLPQSGKPFADF